MQRGAAAHTWNPLESESRQKMWCCSCFISFMSVMGVNSYRHYGPSGLCFTQRDYDFLWAQCVEQSGNTRIHSWVRDQSHWSRQRDRQENYCCFTQWFMLKTFIWTNPTVTSCEEDLKHGSATLSFSFSSTSLFHQDTIWVCVSYFLISPLSLGNVKLWQQQKDQLTSTCLIKINNPNVLHFFCDSSNNNNKQNIKSQSIFRPSVCNSMDKIIENRPRLSVSLITKNQYLHQ